MSDCLRKMLMSDEFNKAITSDKLKAAEQELEDFLRKHPHLKPYQEKIDDILKNAGEKRLEAIAILMAGQVAALQKAWLDLNEVAKALPIP